MFELNNSEGPITTRPLSLSPLSDWSDSVSDNSFIDQQIIHESYYISVIQVQAPYVAMSQQCHTTCCSCSPIYLYHLPPTMPSTMYSNILIWQAQIKGYETNILIFSLSKSGDESKFHQMEDFSMNFLQLHFKPTKSDGVKKSCVYNYLVKGLQ